MKYDTDVNPGDANTSHWVVAGLVGSGNRVLDIGCSTGYLGRLLTERGNTVVGVEIDEEAAAQAEQVIERVVVGDLEHMDLAAVVGPEPFDVVVMADVLEHLVDPVRVLRQAASLLSPGGSVVVSIPNIAHGAVRLSLLTGRFDYHPLGLLDDTHIRFFTRTTVDALLRAAGLVGVEWRRTTADLFGTEIPLDARDFSEELIDDVQADPDSTTYQFVVRAVPVSQGEAARGMAVELVATSMALQSLQLQVETLVRNAAAVPEAGPSVGIVWSGATGPDRALGALRLGVVEAEVRRRLPGYGIRTYAGDAAEPLLTWRGEVVQPLLPWSASRAADLAGCHDMVLACGEPPADDVVTTLTERGCDVALAAVTGGDRPQARTPAPEEGPHLLVGRPVEDAREGRFRFVPDPLLLADRLARLGAPNLRLDVLRFQGRLPVDRPYLLVQLSEVSDTVVAAVARSLDELAERKSGVLVILAGGQEDSTELAGRLRAHHVTFATDDALDLMALVAGSDTVITDTAGLAALAVGLRRPVQALADRPPQALTDLGDWLGDPDLIVDRPAALLATEPLSVARAEDTKTLERLVDTLDGAFDELATQVRGSLGRRAASLVPMRLRDLTRRVATLEAANAGLQQRLAQERVAFAARARELVASGGSVQPAVDESVAAAQVQVLRMRSEHLEKELAAVYATKTMRALKPAREAYRRLRTMLK